MIIAIDGPAGTGKSTIASMIAEKLNITFLNSGGFYRTMTYAVLEAGIDYTDEAATLEFCKKETSKLIEKVPAVAENKITKKDILLYAVAGASIVCNILFILM